jgi:hypothetical protein
MYIPFVVIEVLRCEYSTFFIGFSRHKQNLGFPRSKRLPRRVFHSETDPSGACHRLSEKVSGLTDRLDKVENESKDLKRNIEDLEGENKSLNGKITNLNADIDDLKSVSE